jgi:threonine synthase
MKMPVVCPDCELQEKLSPERWRCDCGGAWEFVEQSHFEVERIDSSDFSIWRYRRLFELPFEKPGIRLNAGWTPLLPLSYLGREVLFKLEYLNPTASFKDRGTAVMMNIVGDQGVRHVVDDSSGNAGASVAAYAAAGGIQTTIFVPAYASLAKQAQISVYGAEVRPIPGTRADAKHAAWDAVGRKAAMASHAYHPGFLLGQQSVAWELWEQMGGDVPDWYVLPVGQGVHLLGAWLGFRRLQMAGLADRIPRLVAVQAAALAPVCRAFQAGLHRVPPIEATGRSVAEGLAIAEPVRGRRLLQAISDTRGMCVVAEDEATLHAQQQLAHQGLFVEPTSATAVAALEVVFRHAEPGQTIAVPLTGSGLKAGFQGQPGSF